MTTDARAAARRLLKAAETQEYFPSWDDIEAVARFALSAHMTKKQRMHMAMDGCIALMRAIKEGRA